MIITTRDRDRVFRVPRIIASMRYYILSFIVVNETLVYKIVDTSVTNKDTGKFMNIVEHGEWDAVLTWYNELTRG